MVKPSPDFTYSPGVTPLSGGCRPYREGSFRLEASPPSGGKTVIHNYGHGGAGISMCWGCAQEVVDLVKARVPQPTGKPIAVLGAGVMGLTAATLLEQLGMVVTILAKDFPPNTTSDVAGGQWAPAKVNGAAARLKKILINSFREHERRGPAFGVSRRTNYSLTRLAHFDLVTEVVPPPERPHLPFKHLNRRGFAYKTLLVEPPIFLAKLVHDLRARPNVSFETRDFRSQAEVMALPPNIIVNCLGMGARPIWNDTLLKPVRGQLVLLPAQPNLDYLFSGGGYVFPRKDCTVIGGTYEENSTGCAPEEPRCAQMVRDLEMLFGGERAFVSSWMIQDE